MLYLPFAQGININIVECKGNQKQKPTAAEGSINRNIVECKAGRHTVHYEVRRCINRNIVECKVICRRCVIHNAIVLIETLWNVKPVKMTYKSSNSKVLIETLWNVKDHIKH